MTRPLSSAALDGVLIEIPCRRAPLAEWLAEQGPLTIASKSRQHPVYCELWRVHDGGLCVGGASQHDLWELGGRASGVALRAIAQTWAPLSGPMRQTLLANARASAELLPGLFRRFSQALVAPLSTYFEIMLWIPGVTLRGRQETFSFVTGMFTDSALARWADAAFGFGYRKQPARFDVPSPETFSVKTLAGIPLLAFSGKRCNAALRKGPLGALESALQSPLLGLTPGGSLAQSTLKRSLTTVASMQPLIGAVQLAPNLFPGSAGQPRSARAGSRKPWNALVFSNMRAVVSYPAPVR